MPGAAARTALFRAAPLPAILALAACAAPASPRLPASAYAPIPADAEERPATDDGWPDVSEFLKKKYGFLPVPILITEPAVGYGLGGGLAFISEPLVKDDGFNRPNISFVGGFRTENDSQGGVIGDVRYWMEDRLQTVAAVIRSSVNLDFHGVGDVLGNNPLEYNIQPEGGFLQGKYRLGDTRLWAGASFAYARAEVEFEAPASAAGIPDFARTTHVGGLTPSLTWDTRDNVLTPIRGAYVEGGVGLYAPVFGADTEYQRARLLAMQFTPLGSDLYLGVRGQAASTFGDPPFYLQPFIDLRGVPKLRYQGETTAEIEAELRWQFWGRLSAVGFVGAGSAWNDFDRVENRQSVVSGGTGFRYELAREHGIHVGLDVAFADGDTAIYIQIGSAWARP